MFADLGQSTTPSIGLTLLLNDGEAMSQSSNILVMNDDQQIISGLSARFDVVVPVAEADLVTGDVGHPACLVAGLRPLLQLCTPSGLTIADFAMPVVVVAEQVTATLAVTLMHHGAVTVLESPWTLSEIEAAVRRGLQIDRQRLDDLNKLSSYQRCYNTLTQSERAVLRDVVAGMTNKEIACAHDVSDRTVEGRKRSVLRKMQAASTTQLVAMVIEAKWLATNLAAPRDRRTR